jgi:hypothetical protein
MRTIYESKEIIWSSYQAAASEGVADRTDLVFL